MMFELQSAMNDLRAATMDPTLAHPVKAGRMRLVRVTYDHRGDSTIEEVRGWLPIADHLADLHARIRSA